MNKQDTPSEEPKRGAPSWTRISRYAEGSALLAGLFSFGAALVGLGKLGFPSALLIGGIVVAIVVPLYLFLSRFLASDKNSSESPDAEEDGLSERLHKIEHALAALEMAPTAGERISIDEVVEKLRPAVSEAVSDDVLRKASERVSYSKRDQQVQIAFQGGRTRVAKELVELEKRARVNLLIGALSAIIAILVMAFLAFVTTKLETPMDLANYYIPKLSVVVFVEVFAFFFLRMYRTTLGEIRLYQRDLDAMIVRRVSIVAALSADTPECTLSVSKELLGSIRPVTKVKAEAPAVDIKAVLEAVQALLKVANSKVKKGEDEGGEE